MEYIFDRIYYYYLVYSQGQNTDYLDCCRLFDFYLCKSTMEIQACLDNLQMLF